MQMHYFWFGQNFQPATPMFKGPEKMKKIEILRRNLARIGAEGTPALRSFAHWVPDNLSSVAFNSIRGLAGHAGVNPNTVTRLAVEWG